MENIETLSVFYAKKRARFRPCHSIEPFQEAQMNKDLRILPLSAVLLAGCGTLTPGQQTTLTDVTNTALGAGLGYLTGGVPGAIAGAAPDLVTDVSDAAYALRTAQGPNATGWAFSVKPC